MTRERIQIGNKLAWPSEPYCPMQGYINEFVGREEILKLIAAAWMASSNTLPMSPILEGGPGVGKTRIACEMSLRTGRELYIFQGHEDITAEDLACTVRFSDIENNKMDYVISPVLTAMVRGGICFIDEIGKIRPRALALLASLLDERRYMDSTLLGERVFAHNSFRFIAATNTEEINTLPEFISSRLRPAIKVDYPPRWEIDQIINRQFSDHQVAIEKLLNVFWMLWEKNTRDGQPPTPRDAIHLFGLATSLRDFQGVDGVQKFALSSAGNPFPLIAQKNGYKLEAWHLEQAFEQLFNQKSEEI